MSDAAREYQLLRSRAQFAMRIEQAEQLLRLLDAYPAVVNDVELRARELRAAKRPPGGDRTARVDAAKAKVRANTNLLNVRRGIDFSTRAMKIFAGMLGVDWTAPLGFITGWGNEGSSTNLQNAGAAVLELREKLLQRRDRATQATDAARQVAVPYAEPIIAEELTVTAAAKRAGAPSWKITRAVDKGALASNGLRGRARRIPISGERGLIAWMAMLPSRHG